MMESERNSLFSFPFFPSKLYKERGKNGWRGKEKNSFKIFLRRNLFVGILFPRLLVHFWFLLNLIYCEEAKQLSSVPAYYGVLRKEKSTG